MSRAASLGRYVAIIGLPKGVMMLLYGPTRHTFHFHSHLSSVCGLLWNAYWCSVSIIVTQKKRSAPWLIYADMNLVCEIRFPFSNWAIALPACFEFWTKERAWIIFIQRYGSITTWMRVKKSNYLCMHTNVTRASNYTYFCHTGAEDEEGAPWNFDGNRPISPFTSFVLIQSLRGSFSPNPSCVTSFSRVSKSSRSQSEST